MRNPDSPYLFGEVEDEEEEEEELIETPDVSRETVIVDGAAMSYRGYQRQLGEE
ncbi:hypothetical protein [Halomarina oriensis]|uniref:Uncharacterized protein n=1 Tax=Halomarina oriensis TaxID=671145 RepID=A0A6B0GWN6_9EURY|nr:hypothetical protein [Halomarina oriensis]MWG36158.1 hypothetical protein [Halomarina oriensis]